MRQNRRGSVFFYIVTAAFLGLVLIGLPPFLASNYRKVAEIHPMLGYIYLSIIGIAIVLVIVTAIIAYIKIQRNTKEKQGVREKLSPDQQRDMIEQELEKAKGFAVSTPIQEREEISQIIDDLQTKLESKTLEIVAFGTISSGKSSVLNALAGRNTFRTDPKGGTTTTKNEIPWPTMDRVFLVDTPGIGEIYGEQHVDIAVQEAKNADMIIFVVDGPLKDFEFRFLKSLIKLQKRLILCLNKVDWITDDDRSLLIEQMSEQVKGLIESEDIVSVKAQPSTRTRIRVMPDGTEHEEDIIVESNISELAKRMIAIIKKDGSELLLANLIIRSKSVMEDARRGAQELLDQRAQEIVSQYMWGAGSAAALTPIPLLDIAVGVAISFAMIRELAKVYNQSIDMNTAQMIVSQMGKSVLGNVSATAATSALPIMAASAVAASPTLATYAASMLKTIPLIGTIAGGILQGLTQALITRWIGSVFIEYFRKASMEQPTDGELATLATNQWERITKPAELVRLVQEGTSRLK